VHMSLLGEKGLRDIAAANHARAVQTAQALANVPGVTVLNEAFFNEFTVLLSKPSRDIVRDLAEQNVLAGVSLGRLYPDDARLEHGLVIAATECTQDKDIEALAAALAGELA
jgi:glycine dehydrogenase subunit 1